MISRMVRLFFLFFGVMVLQAQEFSPDRLTGKVTVDMKGDLSGLQPEVVAAFNRMAQAAAEEGIALKVVSGYRGYQRQKEIWNDKYRAFRKEGLTPPQVVERIIEYSTIPGTSRHHWGTDMDIIDEAAGEMENVLVPDKYENGGPFSKMKLWMDAHAASYGFYLVYTNDPARKGFHYEPWHYSYAPIAVPMFKAFLQLDLEKAIDPSELFGGQLLGGKMLEDYKNEHILGINPQLKK